MHEVFSLAPATSRNPGRRCSVTVQAKRSAGPGKGADSGFGFERRSGAYRFRLNKSEYEVRDDQLWQVALPTLAALLFTAAAIGPLVIGAFVFMAVFTGFALTASAILTSFFLPLFFFLGFSSFIAFGSFSTFAAIGMGFMIPKLMGAAMLGLAGLGAGVLAVNRLLQPAPAAGAGSGAAAAPDGSKGRKSRTSATSQGGREAEEVVVAAEFEDVDPGREEQDRQLREFDELLKERQQQKRAEAWRQSRTGGSGSSGTGPRRP